MGGDGRHVLRLDLLPAPQQGDSRLTSGDRIPGEGHTCIRSGSQFWSGVTGLARVTPLDPSPLRDVKLGLSAGPTAGAPLPRSFARRVGTARVATKPQRARDSFGERAAVPRGGGGRDKEQDPEGADCTRHRRTCPSVCGRVCEASGGSRREARGRHRGRLLPCSPEARPGARNPWNRFGNSEAVPESRARRDTPPGPGRARSLPGRGAGESLVSFRLV